ncbi:MAG: gamma-glutamyl-gamma-aminobutyrate hydrolase family protein [Candidatus Sumerlaeaceae bacterium]|nr:gamma-glutamyl-gamma-aminobutyrate hydrolase family protein [Candidatus Sumerlaeaceae bacterium]
MEQSQPVIIGINTDVAAEDKSRLSVCARTTYVDAVVKAGGVPILLPAITDLSVVQHYVAYCDGFVFIGGGDVSARRYGKSAHPMETPLHERREDFDFALIQEVISARKPFLGICLGAQEVNVALGGTLIQDIASDTTTSLPHYSRQGIAAPLHLVKLVEGSALHAIVRTTELLTNTSHHQAIETPGRGLKIVAHAEDGIIEACELEDHPFGLCVQWHPEAMTDRSEHLALFQALVEAARSQSSD